MAVTGPRRELVRVVQRIQTLTLEITELRRVERDTPELDARERELDDLRWPLAAVARRTAADDRSGPRATLAARSLTTRGLRAQLVPPGSAMR